VVRGGAAVCTGVSAAAAVVSGGQRRGSSLYGRERGGRSGEWWSEAGHGGTTAEVIPPRSEVGWVQSF